MAHHFLESGEVGTNLFLYTPMGKVVLTASTIRFCNRKGEQLVSVYPDGEGCADRFYYPILQSERGNSLFRYTRREKIVQAASIIRSCDRIGKTTSFCIPNPVTGNAALPPSFRDSEQNPAAGASPGQFIHGGTKYGTT